MSEAKGSIELRSRDKRFECSFDKVFSARTTQEGVWEFVKGAVAETLKGYNSTIFAYGQTGSGKTYTMCGPEDEEIAGTKQGIIPRALKTLFAQLKTAGSMFCSFIQIYNEKLFDLLRDPDMGKSLKIHNDSDGTIFVKGLSQFKITSMDDALMLLERGTINRATRSTTMNQASSRSHSVFQVIVTQPVKGKTGSMLQSKLNLVDLAGSEKWKVMNNMDKDHIKELQKINLSLHTLGRCIEALAQKGSRAVPPFRESQLTRLLQDSLEGNTKTFVIAAVSPSILNINESISTLKFADRARNILTTTSINTVEKIDKATVEKLKREIRHLRGFISSCNMRLGGKDKGDGGGGGGGGEAFNMMEKEMLELREENFSLRQQLEEAEANMANKGQPRVQPMPSDPQAGRFRIENKELRRLLAEIRKLSKRFFNLTIEEDEFESQLGIILNAAGSPKRRGATAPISSPSRGIAPTWSPTRRSTTAIPLTPLSGPSCLLRTAGSGAGLQFRVRTARADGGQWRDPVKMAEKRERKQLKQAAKKLAEQEKMRDWFARKAKEQLDKLEFQDRVQKERMAQQKRREQQFRKHALRQKQKLQKFQNANPLVFRNTF